MSVEVSFLLRASFLLVVTVLIVWILRHEDERRNRIEKEEYRMEPVGYLKTRPNWDEFGLEMAKAASLRADCTRRKVGAALMLPDHSIVITGYNGGPSKGPSCLEGECPRGRLTYDELPADSTYDTGGGTCVALHAEWNVLLRASWGQMVDSTLYITEEPCHICKVLISGTRIARVMWPSGEWKVKS